MEHKYIEYRKATMSNKVIQVMSIIMLLLVVASFLFFLVKWENTYACISLCVVIVVLNFVLIELKKDEKTFCLLNEEGIFAYDGAKNKWIYYDWAEMKSAYYRWAGKAAYLILSPHELDFNQVKKFARGASYGASLIHDDGSIVLVYSSSDETFKFIESKLDFVSDKWYL